MLDLLGRTAVTAAGRPLTVGDLVLAGARSGAWQSFEAGVRAGLGRDGDVDPARLRAAAIAWRRERGLIAGDELNAWLAERGIAKDAWTGHLRRGVAEPSAPASVDADEVAAVLRDEALCSGILTELAEDLVLAAGAAAALEESGAALPADPEAGTALAAAARSLAAPLRDLPDLEERAAAVTTLQAARAHFVAERVRAADVERLLADHHLDWATVAWDEAAFATESAAKEAAMLVREDGLALAEAAAVAGAPLTRTTMLLGEVGGELGPLLVAAAAGDVLGPRTGADGVSRLVAVAGRTAPSTDDAALEARARRELLVESLTRHLTGNVVWHGVV